MHILKKSSSLILLVAVGMILSACDSRTDSGGNQGSNSPVIRKIVDWHELSPDTTFDTTKEVSITFWHRMGASSQLIVQRWINEFKVLYPNVTVLEEKVASDYNALSSKVALSIASGTEPDIVESYPDHVARYAQALSPLALNHFIDHPVYGLSQEEVADFLPGLWSEGQSYDNAGTILSLPFTKSSEGFFYNQAYFDLHDYEVPTTWAEVFTIAEDIKSREADAIPFGYDSSDNLFITASKQWGAPYTGYNLNTGNGEVQFNNPQSKEMVKFFKDKVDRGLMITRDLNGESFTSDIFKTNQKLYMYVGSTGGTRYAIEGMAANIFNGGAFKVGVAPLPSKDASVKAQIQQGPNINLLKKADEQRMLAAWLFAKYMTSAENSAQFAIPSGYAPIRYSSYETALWTNYVNGIVANPTTISQAVAKLVKEAIEMFLENGDVFFTSAVFNLSSKTRTEVGELLTKILSYKGTDLDAFIDAEYQDSFDFIVN